MCLSYFHRHRHFDQTIWSRFWLETHVVSFHDFFKILQKAVRLLSLISLAIFESDPFTLSTYLDLLRFATLFAKGRQNLAIRLWLESFVHVSELCVSLHGRAC